MVCLPIRLLSGTETAEMIPLTEPHITEDDRRCVEDTMRRNWVSTAGDAAGRFEYCILSYTNALHAISTSTGTSALHLALLAAGVKPGDGVVIPDFTFIATANAVAHCSAIPILVDISRETLAMDTALLREFFESKTQIANGQRQLRNGSIPVRAMVVVYPFGWPPDMKEFLAISNEYNVPMIEDAAAALGSTISRKHPGTWGLAACLSFNGNKIMTTGGGGMILTNQEQVAEEVRFMREQSNQTAHPDRNLPGFNCAMPALNAALGLGQCNRLVELFDKKIEIFDRYVVELQGSPFRVFNPAWKGRVYNKWITLVECEDPVATATYLAKRDVRTALAWRPIHQTGIFRKPLSATLNGNSVWAYNTFLALPSSCTLTGRQQTKVLKDLFASLDPKNKRQ